MNMAMTVLRALVLAFVAALILAAVGVTGPALVALVVVILFIVGMALPERHRCEHCRGRMRSGATVCHHCGREAADGTLTAA
jgi:hypothetical protein